MFHTPEQLARLENASRGGNKRDHRDHSPDQGSSSKRPRYESRAALSVDRHSGRGRTDEHNDRSYVRSFQPGAGMYPVAVCVVCLSSVRDHNVKTCCAERTWHGKHETFAKCVNGELVARKTQTTICLYHNLRSGCQYHRTGVDVCSGCGARGHGAQSCSRAQNSSRSDAA